MSAERAFIETLRALAKDPAARGLQDDCAVLDVGGETLILTHDTMVEGVHTLLINEREARVLTGGDDPAAAARELGDRVGRVVVTLASVGLYADPDSRGDA